MSELPLIVIGIPGKWANRSTILESIVKNSNGYLFAGMILMNIESQWSCNLEIYEKDTYLKRAFEIAGGDKFSETTLSEIDNHTFTIYLSCDGGSFENARALMLAAKAILDCGGIAVKIESSGIAHTAERWRELASSELSVSLIHAYVAYVGSDRKFYSCGMHNLGFRDCVVTANIPLEEVAHLLFVLNSYIALEQKAIDDGETFGIDLESPCFRVFKKPCRMFSPDDLFHNPYGMFELFPV